MKKKKNFLAAVLSLTLAFGVTACGKPDKGEDTSVEFSVYDLRVDDVDRPVGVDNARPRFSWKLQSDMRGVMQTAYQVEVAAGGAAVWDSGKTESADAYAMYGGPTLASSAVYDWTVTVYCGDAHESISSSFETGLVDKAAFADAKWISAGTGASDATEYTIDFDFTVDTENQGFCFGMQGSGTFFMWQVNTFDNPNEVKLRPHIKTAGVWTGLPGAQIPETDLTGIIGTPSEVRGKKLHERIAVSGRTVTVYFGEDADSLTQAATYTHTEVIPLGGIGFRQCSDPNAAKEVTYYDNIAVTAGGETIYAYDFESGEIGFGGNQYIAIEDGMLRVGSPEGSANEQVYTQTDGEGLPAFRRSFVPGKAVRSAKLYASGLGVFEAYVNGARVGRRNADGSVRYDELKPGSTEMADRKMYYTYDVTHMLAAGENVLSAIVTSGWWSGRVAASYGQKTAFWCKLLLTYTDGTQEVIVTDATWKSAHAAPVTAADIYDGESYDARISTEWQKPGFDDGGWAKPVYNTEFSGELVSGYYTTVTVRDDLERSVQSVAIFDGVTGADNAHYGKVNVVRTSDTGAFTLGANETAVVDFGQNFAGWERFSVSGERGTVITVKHGEMLNDGNGARSRGNDNAEGTVYQANLRSALAKTRYTLAGGGTETYNPSFTYYGFRYIEITATAEVTFTDLVGQVVTSVERDAGQITTSDDNINRLIGNIRWGQYSNYLSVPSDCPQRDERLGWTADTQVFAQTGLYLGDNKNFLRKYIQDLSDAQWNSGGTDPYHDDRELNGAIPGTVPTGQYGGDATYWGGTGWADAAVIVPYRVYSMSGDVSVIEQSWTMMTKWMEYLSKTDKKGGTPQWGDHLAVEGNGDKIREILGVAYYAWDAQMMAEMAQAVGKTAEAGHYREVFETEKAYFIDQFVRADGTLVLGYQTACAYALYLDLLPDAASVQAVAKQLTDNIDRHGRKIQTGFMGTAVIMQALTKAGCSDYAYMLLLQDQNPSWLYSVLQGGTTTWERWDSYTIENGFGDAGMNSFNHYAYGAVAAWMFESMAGIGYDPSAPGFKNILFAPQPSAKIPSTSAVYESVHGHIEAHSRFEGTEWKYDVTVPANATATVKIPAASVADVRLDGGAIAGADGVLDVSVTDGFVLVRIGSGTYSFGAAKSAVL